jgi:L-lactate dehydrogenase complex protein LldE
MEGPTVQLIVTCLVDSLAPAVGRATVSVLETAGCDVEFPEGQTCCGQPAFNVGLNDEARMMAAHTLEVLDATEGPIVLPSGSCAEMIIHHYRELFAGSERASQAAAVAARVRELTQFLVDDLDVELSPSCGGCVLTYHHSCHGLRGLGLGHQAKALLAGMPSIELEGAEECCGFGGLFALEMPAVSAAIMNEKLDRVEASGADTLVGGDVSCLLHLEGGLRRRGSKIKVKHIAEVLAGASHSGAEIPTHRFRSPRQNERGR